MKKKVTYAEFASIEKIEDLDDGSVIVWGRATDETIDSDQQIVDAKFAATKLREWFNDAANIRVMHSTNLYPAGRGIELVTENDAQWLRAHIVEPTAIKLVKEGVLRAYSVGIDNARVVRDMKAKGGRIVDGEFVEVSLVDRPANPSANITVVKMTKTGPVWTGGAAESSTAVKNVRQYDSDSEPVGDSTKPATDPVNAGTRACPLCSGTGKILEGNRTCPRCHGTGRLKVATSADEKDETAAKRQMQEGIGETGGPPVDRDSIPDERFVFPDERVFPITHPDDVPDAVSSWGRYRGKKTFATFKNRLTELCHALGQDYVDALPKSWQQSNNSKRRKMEITSAAAELAGSAADLIRDATEVSGASDPAVIKGKLESVANTTQEIISAANELLDASTPKPDVTELAKLSASRKLHDVLCPAYSREVLNVAYPALAQRGIIGMVDLKQFKDKSRETLSQENASAWDAAAALRGYTLAEALTKFDASVIDQAQKQLHKSFMKTNSIRVSDEVVPGHITPNMFRRPFITTHRANMKPGKNQRPRIPLQSHVPDPTQFNRGPLVAGHQAPVPGFLVQGSAAETKDKGSKKSRNFYTNNARDAARQVMMALHDWITGTFGDDFCPLQSVGGVNQPTDEMATDEMHNMSAAVPVAVSGKKNKSKSKSKSKRKKKRQMKNLEKKLMRKLHKNMSSAAKERSKSADKISKLRRQVTKLEKMPTPDGKLRKAFNLAPTISAPAQSTSAPDTSKTNEDELHWLAKRAHSTDARIAGPALEQLKDRVTPEQLADLLRA